MLAIYRSTIEFLFYLYNTGKGKGKPKGRIVELDESVEEETEGKS